MMATNMKFSRQRTLANAFIDHLRKRESSPTAPAQMIAAVVHLLIL